MQVIYTVHTVSFSFKFSGRKKLVKLDRYKIKSFITNFCENSSFYKPIWTNWRKNAALILIGGKVRYWNGLILQKSQQLMSAIMKNP